MTVTRRQGRDNDLDGRHALTIAYLRELRGLVREFRGFILATGVALSALAGLIAAIAGR